MDLWQDLSNILDLLFSCKFSVKFALTIIFKIIRSGICYFLFIDLTETEKEREREKHQLSASPFISCPLYVPWPGIKPATLAHQDDVLTNCATQPGLQTYAILTKKTQCKNSSSCERQSQLNEFWNLIGRSLLEQGEKTLRYTNQKWLMLFIIFFINF